jgi:hypothetical protein
MLHQSNVNSALQHQVALLVQMHQHVQVQRLVMYCSQQLQFNALLVAVFAQQHLLQQLHAQ